MSLLLLIYSPLSVWHRILHGEIISRALYDKRISQEVEGEALGDEFAGYVSAFDASCTLIRVTLARHD